MQIILQAQNYAKEMLVLQSHSLRIEEVPKIVTRNFI